MMDFGSSSLRETADRYHHSSEAIGKMEKRTPGSHNNSRCRSINTRKAKKAKKLWEKKERSSKEKAYEEHLLQQAPCKQRYAKKGNAEDGFPVEQSSLCGRDRGIKPIDDAHHIRDCNNKQSEVWFLLLIASLDNRSRNTLSDHH
jgi:hypothetical protein